MRYTGMKTEKKAILGGSFDPVHMGHINLFHSICTLTPITTLYVIPAFRSAFKKDKRYASFDERMEMLYLSIIDYSDIYPEDDLYLVVSSLEGERKGVSYTSDTIRELFDELQDEGKVNFIVGSDIIPTLEKWHDWPYLRDHVRFWCFRRETDEAMEIPQGAEVIFVHSPLTHASSTEVREGNLEMLSPSVLEYVEDAGLYKNQEDSRE